ncbi:MAG: BspA family leucine-rich repeat surface protein, partial [Atopobiaceae bacterium]|nr:BspA family leucine-rich repeat surface protein [Atopobiaceae bacterium]
MRKASANRLFTFVLSFLLAFSTLPVQALAEVVEEVVPQEEVSEPLEAEGLANPAAVEDALELEAQLTAPDAFVELEEYTPGDDGVSAEELATWYAEQQLLSALPEDASEDTPPLLRSSGFNLSTYERRVVDQLKPMISAVAAGERSSTVFDIDMTAVFGKQYWTASDLGVDYIWDDSGFNEAAISAFDEMTLINQGAVINVLLADCPYELYWYQKTESTYFPIAYGADYIDGEQVLFFADNTRTFYFPVDTAYATGETTTIPGSSITLLATVSTLNGQRVNGAVANAQLIVSGASGTPAEMLEYFKQQICSRVEYDHDAADGNADDGDPWQIINVFDDDENTNVVCEGYSKAFKYLCDLADIDGVSVILASGTMSGGTGEGPHMWNIVNMDDGYNYLIDVTNCDEGSIGEPDLLFMVPPASGEIEERYTFTCGDESISYAYDSDTRSTFTDADLTLSGTPYEAPDIPAGGRYFVDASGNRYLYFPVTIESGEGLHVYPYSYVGTEQEVGDSLISVDDQLWVNSELGSFQITMVPTANGIDVGNVTYSYVGASDIETESLYVSWRTTESSFIDGKEVEFQVPVYEVPNMRTPLTVTVETVDLSEPITCRDQDGGEHACYLIENPTANVWCNIFSRDEDWSSQAAGTTLTFERESGLSGEYVRYFASDTGFRFSIEAQEVLREIDTVSYSVDGGEAIELTPLEGIEFDGKPVYEVPPVEGVVKIDVTLRNAYTIDETGTLHADNGRTAYLLSYHPTEDTAIISNIQASTGSNDWPVSEQGDNAATDLHDFYLWDGAGYSAFLRIDDGVAVDSVSLRPASAGEARLAPDGMTVLASLSAPAELQVTTRSANVLHRGTETLAFSDDAWAKASELQLNVGEVDWDYFVAVRDMIEDLDYHYVPSYPDSIYLTDDGEPVDPTEAGIANAPVTFSTTRMGQCEADQVKYFLYNPETETLTDLEATVYVNYEEPYGEGATVTHFSIKIDSSLGELTSGYIVSAIYNANKHAVDLNWYPWKLWTDNEQDADLFKGISFEVVNSPISRDEEELDEFAAGLRAELDANGISNGTLNWTEASLRLIDSTVDGGRYVDLTSPEYADLASANVTLTYKLEGENAQRSGSFFFVSYDPASNDFTLLDSVVDLDESGDPVSISITGTVGDLLANEIIVVDNSDSTEPSGPSLYWRAWMLDVDQSDLTLFDGTSLWGEDIIFQLDSDELERAGEAVLVAAGGMGQEGVSWTLDELYLTESGSEGQACIDLDDGSHDELAGTQVVLSYTFSDTDRDPENVRLVRYDRASSTATVVDDSAEFYQNVETVEGDFVDLYVVTVSGRLEDVLGVYSIVQLPSGEKTDISTAQVAAIPDQPYTGSEIEVEVTVSYDGQTLVNGTDYELFYSNNVNSGTATVTIAGIGDYTGTVETTFTILPPDGLVAAGMWGTCPWEVSSDGVLTIHPGTGEENVSYTSPWEDYRESITTISIREENGQKIIAPSRCIGLLSDLVYVVAIDASGLDTSLVTDMSSMFSNCYSLISLDVSGWDTSMVSDMSGLFRFCSSLTELDVSRWDTSRVENMESLFHCCSALTSLDVSAWETSLVTNMDHVFYDCESLTVLDLSNWETTMVWSMRGLFSDCYRLETIYVGSKWTTNNIDDESNGSWVFEKCGSLVGGSGTEFDPNNVDMSYAHIDMPDNPGYLTDFTALSETTMAAAEVSAIADQSYTGEAIEPSVTVMLDGSTLTEGTDYLLRYSGNVNTGTATVTIIGLGDFAGKGAKKITFKIIPPDGLLAAGTWGTCPWEIDGRGVLTVHPGTGGASSVFDAENAAIGSTDMATYGYCSFWHEYGDLITSVVFSEENGQKVIAPEDSSNLLRDLPNMVSADLSGLDTSQVRLLSYLFADSPSLTTVDVSSLDVSSVRNMEDVFFKCPMLTEVDLSGWDTSSVTSVVCMFAFCSSLKTIYAGDTCTLNNAFGWRMFIDCDSLVGGNGTAYATNEDMFAADARNARVDTPETPGYFTAKPEEKIDIANATVAVIPDQTYTGSAIEPEVAVTYNGTTLANGTDYTVAYSNNTTAGTAMVTITGIGDYTGTLQASFSIFFPPLAVDTIAPQVFTGSAIEPEVNVTCDGATLIKGVDYTTAFENNIDSGTAKVTITGIGDYAQAEPIWATFWIDAASIVDCDFDLFADRYDDNGNPVFDYTGEQIKPSNIKVMLGEYVLTVGTDYTVEYGENISDIGFVTLRGQGNFAGSKSLSFIIDGGETPPDPGDENVLYAIEANAYELHFSEDDADKFEGVTLHFAYNEDYMHNPSSEAFQALKKACEVASGLSGFTYSEMFFELWLEDAAGNRIDVANSELADVQVEFVPHTGLDYNAQNFTFVRYDSATGVATKLPQTISDDGNLTIAGAVPQVLGALAEMATIDHFVISVDGVDRDYYKASVITDGIANVEFTNRASTDRFPRHIKTEEFATGESVTCFDATRGAEFFVKLPEGYKIDEVAYTTRSGATATLQPTGNTYTDWMDGKDYDVYETPAVAEPITITVSTRATFTIDDGVATFEDGSKAYRLDFDLPAGVTVEALQTAYGSYRVPFVDPEGNLYCWPDAYSEFEISAPSEHGLVGSSLNPAGAGSFRWMTTLDMLDVSLTAPATMKVDIRRIEYVPADEDAATGIAVDVPENIVGEYEAIDLVVEERTGEALEEAKLVIDQYTGDSFSLDDAVMFDIHYENESGDEVPAPSSMAGALMKVTLPVPDGWDAAKVRVYFMQTFTYQGETHIYPQDMGATPTADGKSVVFYTTHFSDYAMALDNDATPAKVDLSTADIAPIPDQKFEGGAVEPEVTVTLDGLKLAAQVDYTVTYKDNGKPGTATVIVEGAGNYTGTVSAMFNIVSDEPQPTDISGAAIAPIADQEYTGSAITPAVTVTLDGSTLKAGTDYTVEYKYNTAVGTAVVIVTGAGAYAGEAKSTFKIVEPAGPFFLDADPADDANHGAEGDWMGRSGISAGWEVSGGREYRGL